MKITRVELEGLGICHYSGEIFEECIASDVCVCHLHAEDVETFRQEVAQDVGVINDGRSALQGLPEGRDHDVAGSQVSRPPVLRPPSRGASP